jgi:hypothetical protein
MLKKTAEEIAEDVLDQSSRVSPWGPAALIGSGMGASMYFSPLGSPKRKLIGGLIAGLAGTGIGAASSRFMDKRDMDKKVLPHIENVPQALLTGSLSGLGLGYAAREAERRLPSKVNQALPFGFGAVALAKVLHDKRQKQEAEKDRLLSEEIAAKYPQ